MAGYMGLLQGSIYPTVGIVKHSKKMPRYDSELVIVVSLVLNVWWWSTNLSILRHSTYSETHNSGMYQLAGHWWKYFTVSSVTDLFKSIENHII